MEMADPERGDVSCAKYASNCEIAVCTCGLFDGFIGAGKTGPRGGQCPSRAPETMLNKDKPVKRSRRGP